MDLHETGRDGRPLDGHGIDNDCLLMAFIELPLSVLLGIKRLALFGERKMSFTQSVAHL